MLPSILIGPWTVSLYWTMFWVGVMAMGVLLVKRRNLYNLSIFSAVEATVLMTVFGLVGAKLLGALQNLQEVRSAGMSAAGLSFFGAVYFVPIGMMAFSKVLGTSRRKILDAIAPCMGAIVAFMRIGCFCSGCCGGIEANIAGITFYWPVQLIESFGDFLVVGLILHLEKERKAQGKLYSVFLGGYGVLRFIVEFMRDTDKRLLGLGDGQWLAILAVLICIFTFRSIWMKNNK